MYLHRDLCNQVLAAARVDKQAWQERKYMEVEMSAQEKKSKEVYKLVKDVNWKWEPKQRLIKDKQGNLLQTNEDILKRWTEYCSDLYKQEEAENAVVQELERISPPAAYGEDHGILLAEVEYALKRLKQGKRPEPDGVFAEVLQSGGDVLMSEIHKLCEQAWQEETIPEEWTKSVIVTLPKKSDLADCTNCRTLSLINHMCKVFLLVLLERLKAAMEPRKK